MKKVVLFALSSLVSHALFASPAATQAWVSNYVSRVVSIANVVTSNATDATYLRSGSTVLRIENASVYALMATNATASAVAQGVTNGMYFVWHAPTHSYTNRTQTIVSTPSNLVWGAVQSNGLSFSNRFDVVGRILQPAYAKEVTK